MGKKEEIVDDPEKKGVEDPDKIDPDNIDDPEKKDDKVSFESHQKLLNEKKALQKKLDEHEKKNKETVEKELKAKEQFKELAEAKEKELEETKTKLKEKEIESDNFTKISHFVKNATGEIPQQYWSLIPLDSIEIDEHGKVDEVSLKKAVKDFEKQYPEVIKKATKGKMPNGAANGGSNSISYDEWVKLPYKEKMERRKDVTE